MVVDHRHKEEFKREKLARYIGPTTKLSRREGQELFLKGDRSYTDKAARRLNIKPGQSQTNYRHKDSEYGV